MPSVCINPEAVGINAHFSVVAKKTRYILSIEYEYAQLCIFGLALQAVISRNCRDDTSSRLERCPQATPPEEEKYLRGTVRAARTILRTVLDDLLPHGSLTYIPVRSYSRILGATLILLKVSGSSPSLSYMQSFLCSIILNRRISAARRELARSMYQCPLIWFGESLLAFVTLRSMIHI